MGILFVRQTSDEINYVLFFIRYLPSRTRARRPEWIWSNIRFFPMYSNSCACILVSKVSPDNLLTSLSFKISCMNDKEWIIIIYIAGSQNMAENIIDGNRSGEK